MDTIKTNQANLKAPYTLESLNRYLSTLPDAPLQRFLKDKFHKLWLIKADDQHLAHQINLIQHEMMEPMILEGIPWKDVVKVVAWAKPYYQWVKCLSAGKNSSDCQLPRHFLNWRDVIVENDIRKYSR